MTWPTDKASNEHTNQPNDSISSARAEIDKNITNTNAIIDHFNIDGATDGQIMRYDGSTLKWELINAGAITQQSIYIPMGAFAVNSWGGDGRANEAERIKFWQKCLLGGSYMNRGLNNNVVNSQSYYGNIEGSELVRAAHTVNTPSDRTFDDNSNWGPVNITNGVISYPNPNYNNGGNHNYDYHKYSTFTDNYIGLPAGNYRISFMNEAADGTLNSNHTPEDGDVATTGVGYVSNLVVYNATNNTDIETVQMGDLRNEFAFFTLSTDTQLEFYCRTVDNGGLPSVPPDFNNLDGTVHLTEYLYFVGAFNVGADPAIVKGYLGDTTSASGKVWFPEKTTIGIDTANPLLNSRNRLGWITPAPERWIRIDKI